MRTSVRGYFTLATFLMIGATIEWYVLWPLTYDHMVGRKYIGHEHYQSESILIALALGMIGGCCFALFSSGRQLRQVVLASVLVVCIVYAVVHLSQMVYWDFEGFDRLCERTRDHPWLANSIFWLSYYYDGISCWLIPQLLAQLISAATTSHVVARVQRRSI